MFHVVQTAGSERESKPSTQDMKLERWSKARHEHLTHPVEGLA